MTKQGMIEKVLKSSFAMLPKLSIFQEITIVKTLFPLPQTSKGQSNRTTFKVIAHVKARNVNLVTRLVSIKRAVTF